jgi:hypothetical protein
MSMDLTLLYQSFVSYVTWKSEAFDEWAITYIRLNNALLRTYENITALEHWRAAETIFTNCSSFKKGPVGGRPSAGCGSKRG